MRNSNIGHQLEVFHARRLRMLVQEKALNVDLLPVETGHKSLVHACSLAIALVIIQFLPRGEGRTHRQADEQRRLRIAEEPASFLAPVDL